MFHPVSYSLVTSIRSEHLALWKVHEQLVCNECLEGKVESLPPRRPDVFEEFFLQQYEENSFANIYSGYVCTSVDSSTRKPMSNHMQYVKFWGEPEGETHFPNWNWCNLHLQYCWSKKPCTSWQVVYPRISTSQVVVGLLLSTVCDSDIFSDPIHIFLRFTKTSNSRILKNLQDSKISWWAKSPNHNQKTSPDPLRSDVTSSAFIVLLPSSQVLGQWKSSQNRAKPKDFWARLDAWSFINCCPFWNHEDRCKR